MESLLLCFDILVEHIFYDSIIWFHVNVAMNGQHKIAKIIFSNIFLAENSKLATKTRRLTKLNPAKVLF